METFMKKILMIVLIAASMLSMFSIGASASDKPLGSKEYGGHYYRYYDTQMSWEEAKSFCEQRGGHLVTITSSAENEFVASLFSCESVWLGGNDVSIEGQFIWYTNEDFSYSNWGSGEPNNGKSGGQDYIHMYRSGLWDDIESTKLGFVCEWDTWENTTEVSIPNDAVLFNNHYYKFITLDYDWEMAAYYCENMGGHLVTITNAEENEFVNGLSQGQNVWLGGSDVSNEGVFEWLTSETFYYTNWASGEPNDGGRSGGQDYIQMYADGQWDDVENKETKKFVCEWDFCCISDVGTYETHSWNDWQIVKDADCFAEGAEKRECSRCSVNETKTIPQLTHVYNEWKTVKPAECGKVGVEEHTCSLCSNSEEREIAALEHNYGDYEIVSGSKLIPPIVKERKCSFCGGIDRIEDWSYVWVTVVAGIVAIGVIIGLIGYIKAFRKK